MNVFEAVKQSVTTRQAASYYGIRVGRNGMACCPFHNDRTPSMKVDSRYYCFGCGASGDVIDFAASLHGLGNRDAAVSWKIEYAPQPQDAAWHPLFVEALQKNSYVEYLLDILLFGEMEEKAALIAEQGKEVVRLEQRISELTASSAGSSYADDGRNGTGADAGRNPGNAGGDAERRREEQHQELSDSVPA